MDNERLVHGMEVLVLLLALFLLATAVPAGAGSATGSASNPKPARPAKLMPAPRPPVVVPASAPAGSTSTQPATTQRARIIVFDPFFHRPLWYHPFWYRPYAYPYANPATGTLKFAVEPDSGAKAQVYINGGLASEFQHKHSLRLDPGEYKIEVRKPGYQSQARIVHITAGETLRLDFRLSPTA